MLEYKKVFLLLCLQAFGLRLPAVKDVTGTVSKADVVALTFNASTQAAETGGSESSFQDSLVYVASQSYTMRHCLKN